MKQYVLKENVNQLALEKAGFTFFYEHDHLSSTKITGLKNIIDSKGENQQMVIVLSPPERLLKWRFPSTKIPFDPYIQNFSFLFQNEEGVEKEPQTIKEWAKEIHKNAVAHGFWEKEPSFGDVCSLITTEISEAYEEYRNGTEMFYVEEDGKPGGIAIELVDAILRIFDFLESKNIDIESYMFKKHKYNLTRPYKHGGKKT